MLVKAVKKPSSDRQLSGIAMNIIKNTNYLIKDKPTGMEKYQEYRLGKISICTLKQIYDNYKNPSE